MPKNVKIQNQENCTEKLPPTNFTVSVSIPCSSNKYCGQVTVTLSHNLQHLFTHTFDYVNNAVIDNYVQTAFQQYQNC